MSYNIAVVGTGYVGLVSGTVLASTGNSVLCVDIDEKKIKKIKSGKTPIFEPGLEYYLERNTKEGRLKFTTNIEEAVNRCTIFFLCLPNHPNEDGSADLHHLLQVVESISEIIKKNNIIKKLILVNKSTVPVGTAQKVREIVDAILPENSIEIVSNPEFLREGFAVEDALKPERIVVGCSSKYAEEVMKDLYQPFVRSGNPILIMDEKSAEITKYAANSFLAIKISFMNDLSAYCEAVGADIEKIRIGIGSDSRIGKRFLFAGIGYGGSCFPKDVRAIIHSSENSGTPLEIVKAAHNVNNKQIMRFIDKIFKRYDYKLKGKQFAIWGLAFKPNTDDTREAPAFVIIEKLLEASAKVYVYDPEAMENTKLKFGDKIQYAKNMYDCLNKSASLIVATEWTVFRNPDFKVLKETLTEPVIFDGRNLYTLEEMEEMKFEYYCIGRQKSNIVK